MAWLILFVAGLMEVGWAVGLKYTEGFTRLVPSVLTLAAMTVSILLLALALKTLPMGTAYAVWTGIGAVGTAILGIVLFGDPATVARLASIGLIVAGIVGLKLVT
ncbi:MAG: quaternary ammonium compound efflux SMR transporter SugE [Xanthobacteraceae bacterium]